jgi:hypothetical protein
MSKHIVVDGQKLELSKINRVDTNRNGMSIDQLNDGTYILTIYGEFNTASILELP